MLYLGPSPAKPVDEREASRDGSSQMSPSATMALEGGEELDRHLQGAPRTLGVRLIERFQSPLEQVCTLLHRFRDRPLSTVVASWAVVSEAPVSMDESALDASEPVSTDVASGAFESLRRNPLSGDYGRSCPPTAPFAVSLR